MKEHPLLFSGSMVKATDEYRKTQTRRVITPQLVKFFDGKRTSWRPDQDQLDIALSEARAFRNVTDNIWTWTAKALPHQVSESTQWMAYLRWSVGDLIWVRETWAYDCMGAVLYKAAGDSSPEWSPSIHMPRKAARFFLKVTSIRIERLNDITEEDAIAEGVTVYPKRIVIPHSLPVAYHEITHKEVFADLWDSINGGKPGYSWKNNPFVAALTFERVQP